MIRILVEQASVRVIPYTDKKTGERAELRVQQAYAFPVDQDGNASRYPDKMEIVLGRERREPYPVGDYTLHPSAIYVDRNGRLAIAPRLTAVPRPAAVPASRTA